MQTILQPSLNKQWYNEIKWLFLELTLTKEQNVYKGQEHLWVLLNLTELQENTSPITLHRTRCQLLTFCGCTQINFALCNQITRSVGCIKRKVPGYKVLGCIKGLITSSSCRIKISFKIKLFVVHQLAKKSTNIWTRFSPMRMENYTFLILVVIEKRTADFICLFIF